MGVLLGQRDIPSNTDGLAARPVRVSMVWEMIVGLAGSLLFFFFGRGLGGQFIYNEPNHSRLVLWICEAVGLVGDDIILALSPPYQSSCRTGTLRSLR